MQKKLTHLALICGGPSLERGISLNSTRSVADHLEPIIEKLSIFYISPKKTFHALNPSHLYSNTPMDFDFKLEHLAPALSEEIFIKKLKEADLVFPLIHGTYGEDGGLQSFLEKNNIPFVGPSSTTCDQMYHKPKAKQLLEKNGFHTWPSLEVSREDTNLSHHITHFFKKHSISRAVVKPAAGGSSIGVFSVETPEQALEKAHHIFTENIYEQALIEPFCPGREFTLIVLQSSNGDPVALVPSEIQISYDKNQLFDYRRKYLPTANTHWLCPPKFSPDLIDKIRSQGEALFKTFKMRDFTRMDGWVLESGKILFTDFNPISGMEQNSFIFQQAAWMGLSHQELLQYILTRAAVRYNLTIPPLKENEKKELSSIAVLFGGRVAERQVSLMSGTNVWLKLRHSQKVTPTPYFMDLKGHIWHLPYAYALSHTVEEITEKCHQAKEQNKKLAPFQKKIREKLNLEKKDLELPTQFTLESFCAHVKSHHEFVFIGLHGGMGEDGTLQTLLDGHGITYNGSGPEGSAICMDKNKTAELLNQAALPGISALPKVLIHSPEANAEDLWEKACALSPSVKRFIIKPQSDGCSAGVVVLHSKKQLENYLTLLKENAPYIPAHMFPGQQSEIELPQKENLSLMLEPFIETDTVQTKGHDLLIEEKEGWLELTAGVLEFQGTYHALNPSITVANHAVLSLEEKFQGGTGVNLTPPPPSLISETALESLKKRCEQVAHTLKVQNYCRIDVFYHRYQDQLVVIEANSLPALTPSTVIYHQALAETPSLPPRLFLEKLIETHKG